MPKAKKPLTSLIARCRSRLDIRIPHSEELFDAHDFILGFIGNDLVDLYCVTEALVQRYKHQEFEENEAKVVGKVNNILREQAQSAPLADDLAAHKLVTSIDLRIFGYKLLIGRPKS